ncbi:MAG: peptide/nickel transport system substrate-binding protein [Sphingomonadales bacterium]|jgi:peptide/nickel transport system substrate-binding protein|nr:peptide/nickel transport system substrate-binding protein [Sphingomonadales bacterium]
MACRLLTLAALSLLALAGCRKDETGPVAVSAIGGAPRLANPNRERLDAPSAYLLESVAQGLVRFDATGDVAPGLAQSWIVSNDGLRYTFRLERAKWPDGSPITAEQVVARLKAAAVPASANPLKPLLGAIDEIETMTDEVLEISLKAPRPNFLQLLAQPEMAIVRGGAGSGPFVAAPSGDAFLLTAPRRDDEDEDTAATPVLLRGEPAARAVARFEAGESQLVLGGTFGDLPIARAADVPRGSLVFDPVAGLFGLSFGRAGAGPLARAEVRQALSMAIDRPTLVAALGVPGLQPRETLLPAGIEGLAAPAVPAWTASPLPARRGAAARALAPILKGKRLHILVAMPEGPGWRLVFALLRRDWATIGVDAARARPNQAADLHFIDEVAPISLASWYLRHFSCDASAVCDPTADSAMEAARLAPDQDKRREQLSNADRTLAAAAPFIPLAAPVRWSLAGNRLAGFRPNVFGRHPAGELVASAP